MSASEASTILRRFAASTWFQRMLGPKQREAIEVAIRALEACG